MRKVAILAQWYPPCQAWPTAATRARLLATHLPQHGWETIVLVPDLAGGACRCAWCADPDRRLPSAVPGTTVHRLPSRPSVARQVAGWLRERKGTPEGADPGAPAAESEASSLAQLSWLLGDVHSNWARVAAGFAHQLLKGGAVDAILTTSAPFAHIRVGRGLALDHHLPWIADLRDPVSTDVTATGWTGRLVRARRRPYRAPLLDADVITAATAQVVEVDGPWLGREPVLIMPGFDDEEWAAARAAAVLPDRFEIVFTGKLYESYRRPDVFLQGLRLAADKLADADRKRLRFVYYGRSGRFLRELAERYGCSDLVEDRGFVDPVTMPVRAASATALLLLTNDVGSSGVPGGKFYEYLAGHRPILAVPGADQYVADVLAGTGAGLVVHDEHEVAEHLRAWMARWREDGNLAFEGDAAAIDGFSARTSVGRLAELLDAAGRPVPAATSSRSRRG